MLTHEVVGYYNEHTLLPHVSHLGAKEFSKGMGRGMVTSVHGVVFLGQGPGPILNEDWYPVTSVVIEESGCLVL